MNKESSSKQIFYDFDSDHKPNQEQFKVIKGFHYEKKYGHVHCLRCNFETLSSKQFIVHYTDMHTVQPFRVLKCCFFKFYTKNEYVKHLALYHYGNNYSSRKDLHSEL